MENLKKKPVIFIITVILSFIIVLSASFAWFTSTDEKKNHFATAQITDGSVSLFEIFTPPDDWKPGQKVTKEVAVLNSGDSDVLVRISFEEVLFMLGGDGKQKSTTSSTLPTSKDIPVNVSTAALKEENGWKRFKDESPAWTLNTEPADADLPAEVEIFWKTLTVNGKTEYYFAMYRPTTYTKELETESRNVNQKVTAEFAVNSDTKTLTLSNIQYFYFDARVQTQADWAGTNVRVGHPPYEEKDVPVVHPLVTEMTKFLTDKNILIGYSDDTSRNTTIEDGKWYYNQVDGYFYYIGKLLAGTTSPNLVESVTLDPTAGDQYALMDLDLIVLMEAIQNTTDALISETGWNISNAEIDNPQLELYNALARYCQY